MSVHQTDDGRWFVKFGKGTLPHKPNATREYFGRGTDARNNADRRNIDLGLGAGGKEVGKTFAEIANYYILAKLHHIEARSVETAAMHIRAHLAPFFGHHDVTRISEEMADEYVARRRNEKWIAAGGRGGKRIGASRSTIKRELGTMQAILNLAAKRKEILFNPLAHYDMPKEDDAVISPATPEEIQAILAVSPPHLKRFIIIAWYTAIRPGKSELLSMRWSQVDFVGRILNVVSALKGGLVSRRIDIHDDLLQYLLDWYYEDEKLRNMPDYIVHYNGQYISKVDKAWAAAKKRAKVLRRLRLYDIRHSAITAMLENGADLHATSQVAGHKNPAMTMRKYQHVSTGLKKEAIGNLVTLVTNNIKP